MQIKIEEMNDSYLLTLADVSVLMDLKDIENLITHLEYFKNNDSIKSLEIKIGGEE